MKIISMVLASVAGLVLNWGSTGWRDNLRFVIGVTIFSCAILLGATP